MAHDSSDLVVLRTGKSVSRATLDSVTSSLRELSLFDLISYSEVVEIARGLRRRPSRFRLPQFTSSILKSDLLEADGTMRDEVRDIILASVDGLLPVDPVAH